MAFDIVVEDGDGGGGEIDDSDSDKTIPFVFRWKCFIGGESASLRSGGGFEAGMDVNEEDDDIYQIPQI